MKPKLIYFYPAKATFIERDISFLSKNYEVLKQDLPWTNKYLILINFARQKLFMLRNLFGTSVYLVMFGGYWSFLPALFGRIFNKRVFIILGGTDCVSFPEINYGSLRKQPLKWFIKKSYQWAYKLLPVDDSLMFSEYHYNPLATNKTQGVKANFKNLKTPFTVIPNGYDTNFWQSGNTLKTPNSFISIAYVNDRTRFILKGFDSVLKLAEHFKEATFTLVGISKQFAETLQIPKNVTLFNHLDAEAIKKLMTTQQFYLQLSLSEGFPNALAEAMLMRCIPIGSAVGAIPKIINQTGVVLYDNSEALLKTEVRKLLDLPQETLKILGLSAKAQINENFSIKNRMALLQTVLAEAL